MKNKLFAASSPLLILGVVFVMFTFAQFAHAEEYNKPFRKDSTYTTSAGASAPAALQTNSPAPITDYTGLQMPNSPHPDTTVNRQTPPASPQPDQPQTSPTPTPTP